MVLVMGRAVTAAVIRRHRTLIIPLILPVIITIQIVHQTIIQPVIILRRMAEEMLIQLKPPVIMARLVV